jgi:hypothetical protein
MITARGIKMVRPIFAALVVVTFFATNGAEAAPGYSSNPYLNYSCKDLRFAAEAEAARADHDPGVKKNTGSNNTTSDDARTTVFWPKAFFSNVSGQRAVELSHLKDKLISIEQASIQGQCEIQFDGPRPPGA